MAQLEKKQHAPLNVTEEAQHRIFVGLGWDPNDKFGILDEAKALRGGKAVHHDLDLYCYIYDAALNLIERVGAETAHAIDKTGKIYHSGDNTEGLGDGDDEQISVELKELDENIAHIIFVATIKTGQSFGDINSPEMRLGDGYTDRTLHNKVLHEDSAGKDKGGYIFARIYRSAESWMVHNIDDFRDLNNSEDIAEIVKGYIG